ncbi:unnamed protein product [Amoebophrya sp. A25]|nr:unnamed protein product [Amoebophrya sp. A25]|eukprot:GSA25T00016438001.1
MFSSNSSASVPAFSASTLSATSSATSSSAIRLRILSAEDFPASPVLWSTSVTRLRKQVTATSAGGSSSRSSELFLASWSSVRNEMGITMPEELVNVTSDSLRFDIMPQYPPTTAFAPGTVLGYHVVMPLSCAALDRFSCWCGTTAVYPRQQYPNVEQAFYFQNSCSLGQKVRQNNTPCFRVELQRVTTRNSRPAGGGIGAGFGTALSPGGTSNRSAQGQGKPSKHTPVLSTPEQRLQGMIAYARLLHLNKVMPDKLALIAEPKAGEDG